MSEYNGWTNYETWRVNLELIDGIDANHYKGMDTADIRDSLKEMVQEILETSPDLALTYALSFIERADFWQIAEALQENIEEEEDA
jgi:hypothetical protein